MGSLGGHLIPGTFFITFAIFWSFITSIRYIQSRHLSPLKKNKRNGYQGSVAMPCICFSSRNLRKGPTESYFKLFASALGVLVETIFGFEFNTILISQMSSSTQTMPTISPISTIPSTPNFVHDHVHKRYADLTQIITSGHDVKIETWHFAKGNLQHITMYSAFLIGSVVEIMMHKGVELPDKLDYAMGIVAFSIECFLFAFHLHGKAMLEVFVHVLLVYAIFGCVLFCALEAYNPKQVIFTYGRIVCTMLQGTWFYQVGFMLYPPTKSPSWQWDLNDHGSIMTVTVTYCWHVLLIVLALFIQYFIMKKMYLRPNLKERFDELIFIDNKININYYRVKNDPRLLENAQSNTDEESIDELTTFDVRSKRNNID